MLKHTEVRERGATLSVGQKQLLSFARVLAHDPDVLILDEATEGLAPLIRREIWQGLATLKANGHAILIIDKNLDALMALVEGDYAGARAAFRMAQEIKPGSPEPADGLLQVDQRGDNTLDL